MMMSDAMTDDWKFDSIRMYKIGFWLTGYSYNNNVLYGYQTISWSIQTDESKVCLCVCVQRILKLQNKYNRKVGNTQQSLLLVDPFQIEWNDCSIIINRYESNNVEIGSQKTDIKQTFRKKPKSNLIITTNRRKPIHSFRKRRVEIEFSW